MLDQLFSQGRIWQRHRGDSSTTIDTGFEVMNHYLPSGGWPADGVTEILYPQPGLGELSLLLPCLQQLSQQERWLAWVAPPWQLNAAALANAGVDIRSILVINPKSNAPHGRHGSISNARNNSRSNFKNYSRSKHKNKSYADNNQCLWSLEECLKSGAVSAVLGWPQQLKPDQARRLQMCAGQYQVPCFLFKQQPLTKPCPATPCALRLQLTADSSDTLTITVLKQRHGWPPPPFTLSLKRYSPFRYGN